MASYEGDLNERQLVLPTELHLSFGLQYTKVHSEQLAYGLMANMGKITGDDQNFDTRKDWNPNLSFSSPVTDVLGHIRYAPFFKRSMQVYDAEGAKRGFNWDDYKESSFPVFDKEGMALMVDTAHMIFTKTDMQEKKWIYDQYGHLTVYDKVGDIVMDEYKTKIAPYLVVGVGMSFFDPDTRVLNRATLEYDEFTNAVIADPANYEVEYSNSHLTIPIGGGIMFDLSRKLNIEIEAAYRYPFSDYIDGVSNSRSPGEKDWYLMFGLRANYKFGTVKKDYYSLTM